MTFVELILRQCLLESERLILEKVPWQGVLVQLFGITRSLVYLLVLQAIGGRNRT